MHRFAPLLAALMAAPSLAFAADFDLPRAVSAAMQSNPDLRVAAEAIPQARANRDKAFAFVQPTIGLGMQYRINDREIAFDPAEDFGGGADLGEAFGGIYSNLGFIYGEFFENGTLDAQDCEEIAEINGFEDCAALTDAFANGAFDQDESGGDDTPSEPVVIQQKEQLFVNADVTWPISPRVVTMARAGTAQIEAARAQVAEAREQVIAAVVQAYATAYQAQETAGVLASQIELAEAHVADTEVLLTAGLLTADAVLRARVEVARLQLQRREIQATEASARRALGLMMGADEAPAGVLASPASIGAIDPNEARADAARRPDLVAAGANAVATRELAVDQVLQFLPTFAVTGGWTWSNASSGFDDNKSSWFVGIGASVQIWDGGLHVHNLREATSRRRQAAANADALARRVEAEVLDAFDRFEAARDALPVAEAELQLAGEAYRLVQVRYAAGGAKQLEVLDARGALQQAELGYLQRMVGLQLRSVELLAATGGLRGWAAGL